MRVLILLAGLLVAAPSALAQSPATPSEAEDRPRTWSVSLGAGFAYAPDYEGSDEYELNPLVMPKISYREGLVDIGPGAGGPGASVRLINRGGLEARIGLGWQFGRDEDDSVELAGLGDLEGGVLLFAKAGWKRGPFGAGLEIRQDISGDREGLAVEPSVSLRAMGRGGRLRAGLTFSGTWASDDYMSNTFGISAEQSANSGYAAFQAESGLKDIGVSGRVMYGLTRSWDMALFARYGLLLGDASDSPIVDQVGDANQYSLGATLSYSF